MTEKNLSFIDDEEKMYDFIRMDREDFLSFYSYLTEEEYDATMEDVKERINIYNDMLATKKAMETLRTEI